MVLLHIPGVTITWSMTTGDIGVDLTQGYPITSYTRLSDHFLHKATRSLHLVKNNNLSQLGYAVVLYMYIKFY